MLLSLALQPLGLIQTRHFRAQYCNIKIKDILIKIFFFLQNIVDISKYLELPQNKYFQYTQEKNVR